MATVNPIPKGYHTVTPSLTIKNCAKAIDFYRQALGAEELMRMPAPDGSGIWHAELKIGDSIVFMNDEMPGAPIHAPDGPRPASASLWLYVPDCDAAFERATRAGAVATMQPEDMFWGDRCAGVMDPFGYVWNFATHVKDMSQDEMRKGGEEFARRMSRK